MSYCSIFRKYFSDKVIPSIGLKPIDQPCTGTTRGRPCRGGILHDTTLDWESALPEPDYTKSRWFAKYAYDQTVVRNNVS